MFKEKKKVKEKSILDLPMFIEKMMSVMKVLGVLGAWMLSSEPQIHLMRHEGAHH